MLYLDRNVVVFTVVKMLEEFSLKNDELEMSWVKWKMYLF